MKGERHMPWLSTTARNVRNRRELSEPRGRRRIGCE
jgi:hypothetical protein